MRFWKKICKNYHVVVVESNYCVGSPSVFLSKNLKFGVRPNWDISWVIYHESWPIWKIIACKVPFWKKTSEKISRGSGREENIFSLNRSLALPHGWIDLIFLLNIHDVMFDLDMTSFFMTHSLWVIKARFFPFLHVFDHIFHFYESYITWMTQK